MRRFLIFISFFTSYITLAQIPILQWQQCYGTSDKEYVRGIVSKENGFIIALEVISGEGLTT